MAIGTSLSPYAALCRRFSLAKPKWGTKRICLTCSAKFYDLGKDPIICPGCSATFKPDDFTRGRRIRTAPVVEKPPVKPVRPVPSEDDAEGLLIGVTDDDDEIEDDDEDVIEDTTDLGDDDDDVNEVIDGVEVGDDDKSV